MKNASRYALLLGLIWAASSCSLFKRGEGCPSNGRNVGAEKVLSGDAPKKSPKFKGAQSF
ncbi:hypothetical protein [Flaviaesturariibacter amylovorans]|uniref:Lipoprotein n=1 Tax=Flaviaesturariibacter amylovorans TaxID=1084520 RepID=A0ABP8GDB3_9BACT